jgi:translation elongation factor EF-1alpha
VKPGDNVALRVSLNLDDIAKGFMICKYKEPPAIAVNHFLAFLYLADLTETRQIFTAGCASR